MPPRSSGLMVFVLGCLSAAPLLAWSTRTLPPVWEIVVPIIGGGLVLALVATFVSEGPGAVLRLLRRARR